MLSRYKNELELVQLVPSSGGIFDVKVDEEVIFSKKQLNRYPEENEVEEIIKGKIMY